MVKTRILTTIGSALLIVAAGSGPMSLAQAGDAQVAPPRMQKATRYDRAALKQAPRATLRGATISEKRAHFTPEVGLAGKHLYVIELADAPVATYKGKVPGFAPTSIETDTRAPNARAGSRSAGKLDAHSAASQAYAGYLVSKQVDFKHALERKIGRAAEQAYGYQFAFNGVAVRLTQAEAAKAATMAGVRAITRDYKSKIETSRTPTFIGAPGIWDGTETGLPGARGEGMLVGIIDTGINHLHPSFAAVGQDGYVHTNPYGDGVFRGECNDFPGLCNNKLIGAYYYLQAHGGTDPLTPPGDPNTKDTDGHGSHTASTAAGNVVIDPPFLDVFGNDTGVTLGTISGVAPHANIIAYKVCAPDCGAADRVQAVEQAIQDGVDAINHSIGTGPGNPWYEPVAVAFKNARAAGIMVQNSAGNSGPGAGTAESAGNAPWVTGTAASTHDRAIPPKQLTAFAGGNNPRPTTITGLSFSGGYTGPIVWAGRYNNGDPTPAQCMVPFPAGTFTNQIVLCERGTIARVEKCLNVAAGGAKGCVLMNVDGGASDLAADPFVVPGIHITAEDGAILKAWLNTGANHSATITPSDDPTIDSSAADHLADFSSRGPYTGFDFLAPSIAAPGVDIFAAGAGLTTVVNPDASVAGDYGAIGGTSMAAPHATGSATLLKQVHPDWSPAEVLSALATTAKRTMKKEDGTTDADPFDFGGGRIQLAKAVNAGLVLDESGANFDAANPDLGGDPKTLNVPYLYDDGCLIACSWQRTVRATVDGTWTASSTKRDPALRITIEPRTFTLAAGQEQTITVNVDASGIPLNTWTFGEVKLSPGGTTPNTVMQIAVQPTSGVKPESITIDAARDAGSQAVGGFRGIEVTNLQTMAFGLTKGEERTVTISGEYDDFDPYAGIAVATEFYDIPAGSGRLLVKTRSDTAPDIDLFVGRDDNLDGLISPDEERCNSGTSTALERCELFLPEPGRWWVTVLQFASSGAPSDDTVITAAVVGPSTGNIDVSGPGSVPPGQPYDIRVYWDEEMSEGETWYGAVQLGTDAANPDNIGLIPVDILRVPDDVGFAADTDTAAPGQTVTFTATVKPNFTPEELNYTLEASVPAGLTVVPGSITGGGSLSGNRVRWNVEAPSLADLPREYVVTTNRDDPSCDTGFGGYVNLQDLAIFPDSGISGDSTIWTAFTGQNVSFYGKAKSGINFTDDGIAFFASGPGTEPHVNKPIPSAEEPNDMAAIFWNDWEIVYDEALNKGVSLATAGTDVSVIEYDDAQPFPAGSTGAHYDFEIIVSGVVSNSPGAFEVVMAYDNLFSARVNHGITAGVEDATGTTGTQYAYNQMSQFSDDLIVCYDLRAPAVDATELSFDATVDPGASGGVKITTLSNSVDMPGSETVMTDVEVLVDGPTDTDADGVSDEADNCTAVANADQRDTDADGYGNRCDGDFTQDGVVNWLDLGYMRTHFFTPDANADLNGDGTVDYGDLAIIKGLMYAPPGPSALAGGD
jgi:uncharacterized repeat protein (TIGR01451 family)